MKSLRVNKQESKKQIIMNCYAGLAKRLVKSCFPQVKLPEVIPVPQLQPLDARNIIKQEVKIIQAAARGRAMRLAAWDAALLMRKERRRAAKETRQAWNIALDPTTWYRM